MCNDLKVRSSTQAGGINVCMNKALANLENEEHITKMVKGRTMMSGTCQVRI